jgi:large subunit ribosomal protein L3
MSETTQEQTAAQPATPVEPAATPPVKAILAQKLGMTRIYNDAGRFIPVTVLKAGPCHISQVKTKDNDGYTALQLTFGAAKPKNVDKALIGHFAKAQVAPGQWLKEIRVKNVEGFVAGQEVKVSNFAEGDMVDISGFNKGKGYAGVMKRHRFSGGPRTHGQSDRARAPGSSGGQRPQKVFKGIRGPGHMGHEWSTVQRVTVVKVDAEQDLLLIEGSVPGPNKGFVAIQTTKRPKKFRKASSAPVAAKKSGKPAPQKAPAKAGGK